MIKYSPIVMKKTKSNLSQQNSESAIILRNTSKIQKTIDPLAANVQNYKKRIPYEKLVIFAELLK